MCLALLHHQGDVGGFGSFMAHDFNFCKRVNKVSIQGKDPISHLKSQEANLYRFLQLAISHSPDMWTLTGVCAQKAAFILQGDALQDLGTRVTARVGSNYCVLSCQRIQLHDHFLLEGKLLRYTLPSQLRCLTSAQLSHLHNKPRCFQCFA